MERDRESNCNSSNVNATPNFHNFSSNTTNNRIPRIHTFFIEHSRERIGVHKSHCCENNDNFCKRRHQCGAAPAPLVYITAQRHLRADPVPVSTANFRCARARCTKHQLAGNATRTLPPPPKSGWVNNGWAFSIDVTATTGFGFCHWFGLTCARAVAKVIRLGNDAGEMTIFRRQKFTLCFARMRGASLVRYATSPSEVNAFRLHLPGVPEKFRLLAVRDAHSIPLELRAHACTPKPRRRGVGPAAIAIGK